MLCIYNTCVDPYFNLAAEEYLLKNSGENIFMLWQNEPAVIVGKYQHVPSEVNLDLARARQVKVVRRMTGGGSVYHDSGNLNFTFIEQDSTGDFRKMTNQLQEIIAKYVANVSVDDRNNLMINGLKISGSAQCVHKSRALHHATLLFSSDISELNAVLYSVSKEPEKGTVKYVKSIHSQVTNASEYLRQPLNIREFKMIIMDHFINQPGNKLHVFSENDIEEINRLSVGKYALDAWNFGR